MQNIVIVVLQSDYEISKNILDSIDIKNVCLLYNLTQPDTLALFDGFIRIKYDMVRNNNNNNNNYW